MFHHPNATRKRPRLTRKDFSQLEKRQLLAANLGGGLQVPNSLPAETDLVANGDFETFAQGSAFSVVNDGATGRFLPGDQVDGWNVIDGDGDGNSTINLVTFDSERGTVLDLDSIPDQDDRVFQDITTEAGRQYLLTFDYRDSPLINGNTDNSTNDFEVFWNGNLVASMTGGDFWQTAAFTVIGASDTPDDDVAGEGVISRLEFRDMRDGNRGGDGRGSLIDCVRLAAVSETSIVNGGFEDVGADPGPDFNPDDVEGWSVFNFADDVEPRVIRVNEFQSGESAIEGDNYLAVNSDTDLIDQIFQEINTSPGRTYFVTFDYRVDPDRSAEADQLRVRWNDEWAATFLGSTEWQSVGILLDADSDSTRLTFREAGEDAGDGAGVHVDNIQIFTVDQVVNDLLVDLNGSDSGTTVDRAFVEDSGLFTIAPDLTLSHASGTRLSSASVALLGRPAELTEALDFNSLAVFNEGLTADYSASTGLLTIEGDATVAVYQSVLRTVTYQNSAEQFGAATREIGFRITDSEIQIGGTTSNESVAVVSLVSENDVPTLAAIDDQSVDFASAIQFQTSAADVDNETLTYSVSVAGLSAAESQPTVSEAGEFNWTPTEAGEFDVTVSVEDSSNAVADQTFTVTVGALTDIAPVDRDGIYPQAPGNSINTANTYDAVFDTDQGEITVRLLDDESPTFVNNFVSLARDGFYDGLILHRVIDGFVAQGGDPRGTGTGGPGYQIPDEVGNTIPFNSRGQLSYANSGNNTTGSQFFITFGATGLNTNQFSVFGNVTSGDDVLDQLERTFTPNPIPGGPDIPIPGAVPTVVNSITIVETSDTES